MILKVKIDIEGKDTGAILIALEEVTRHLREGCETGADNNEDSAFRFSVKQDEKKRRRLRW